MIALQIQIVDMQKHENWVPLRAVLPTTREVVLD